MATTPPTPKGLALLAGLALAAAGVVTALVVSGDRPAAIESPPPEEVTQSSPASLEQADLEGDFELVDPTVIPSAGLEGVVPSLSDLPVPLTHRTMRYVEHFATTEKGKKAFSERYRRASRFREHLERKLHDENFPEDVVWLAAIESGFNPQATSPAGAAGMFQFMPETGARFGLAQSSEIDERRSITKSADAALAYLRFLLDAYGSWDLALAGYNCGEGRLDQALEKGRAALGRGPDQAVAFHELAELRLLPRETMNFVPQVHAFAIVAHNRELLGLQDLDPLPAMRFAEIAVPAGTRLAPIARAADISIATLREYNPDLLTDRLPSGKGDVLVNIPAESLEQALAALPAHLARDEDAKPSPRDPKEVATRPAQKALPSGGKGSARKGGEPTTAEGGERSTRALEPVPNRPGVYVLESGVLVELDRTESAEVELSARVAVLDPTKARAPTGQTFRVDPRKVKPVDLDDGLAALSADLEKILQGSAAEKLRSHVATRRAKFYERTGLEDMFRGLSDRAFPKPHPMRGALLVGPTEPADDMFLEPEPSWALDTTVVLRGPVDVKEHAELLTATFASPFTPKTAPPLAPSSRATVGKGERHLLVGWASGPLDPRTEAASHLAFMLACHNKLGLLHRALRHDRQVAARVACSLEAAPQGTVAWVFASPAMPHSVTDAEKVVDDAIAKLLKDGVSDRDLSAARGLLRAELAREVGSAGLRGLPKSRVVARTDRIVGAMGEVTRAQVAAAAKSLFQKDHRIVVAGD